MNESFNPQFATEKVPGTLHQTAIHTPLSEAIRALAEKNVVQTREFYEQSKDALEAALETLERSFDAVGQGATALNRKVMHIAQCNIDSGFDLAKSLTAAKDLAEIIELQGAYWRKQFDVLASQAEEVRSLSSQVTTVRPSRSKSE